MGVPAGEPRPQCGGTLWCRRGGLCRVCLPGGLGGAALCHWPGFPLHQAQGQCLLSATGKYGSVFIRTWL